MSLADLRSSFTASMCVALVQLFNLVDGGVPTVQPALLSNQEAFSLGVNLCQRSLKHSLVFLGRQSWHVNK